MPIKQVGKTKNQIASFIIEEQVKQDIWNALIHEGFTGKELKRKFKSIITKMENQALLPIAQEWLEGSEVMSILKPSIFKPTNAGIWDHNIIQRDMYNPEKYNIYNTNQNEFIVHSLKRAHYYTAVRKGNTVYIIDTQSGSLDPEIQKTFDEDYANVKHAFQETYPNAKLKFKKIQGVYDNGNSNCAVHAIVNAELGNYILDKLEGLSVNKKKALKYIMGTEEISTLTNTFVDNTLRNDQGLNEDSNMPQYYKHLITECKGIADKRIKEVADYITKEEIQPTTIKKTPSQSLYKELSVNKNQMRAFYIEDLIDYLKDLNLIKNPQLEQDKLKGLLNGCDKLIDDYIKNLENININSNKQSTEVQMRDEYLQKITKQVFKNLEKITPAAIEAPSRKQLHAIEVGNLKAAPEVKPRTIFTTNSDTRKRKHTTDEKENKRHTIEAKH